MVEVECGKERRRLLLPLPDEALEALTRMELLEGLPETGDPKPQRAIRVEGSRRVKLTLSITDYCRRV